MSIKFNSDISCSFYYFLIFATQSVQWDICNPFNILFGTVFYIRPLLCYRLFEMSVILDLML